MSNPPLLFAPNLVKDYFDPVRGYQVAGLCAELGVQPAGFAKLTRRQTESVAKLFSGKFVKPKEPRTQNVLRQLYQIVAVFRAMGWGKDDVSRWMNSPLPTHQGHTAVELIEQGHGQELIDELLALAVGNVG
jgi:hypothetical protein